MAMLYVRYCRGAGFVYQYHQRIKQDIEGSLEIDDMNGHVTGGMCQDFFEFRMVNIIIAIR